MVDERWWMGGLVGVWGGFLGGRVGGRRDLVGVWMVGMVGRGIPV